MECRSGWSGKFPLTNAVNFEVKREGGLQVRPRMLIAKAVTQHAGNYTVTRGSEEMDVKWENTPKLIRYVIAPIGCMQMQLVALSAAIAVG